MNIIELFSGLGSQAKALKEAGIKYKLLHTCDWNINSIVAYDYIHCGNKLVDGVEFLNREELIKKLSNYNLSSDGKTAMNPFTLNRFSDEALKRLYSSILKTNNLVDVTKIKGLELPDKIDLLTYSFPCQDLSNVGAIHGFKSGIDRNSGSRSGLLWEVERILNERFDANMKLPKYLLLENVTALMSARHRENFEEWQSILEKYGYVNRAYKLNAKNLGLPQNRNRVIMLSVLCDANDEKFKVQNYFKENNLEQEVLELKNLSNFLKLDYNNKIYLEEAKCSQPNNTESRRRMWNDNKVLVDDKNVIKTGFVNTITTKQDRHPNAGNIYFKAASEEKSNYRFLTQRECFLLMGFSENDYENIINNNFKVSNHRYFFSRDNLRKMAGNSIAVCVLVEVFKQMKEIEKQIFGNDI